MTAYCQMELDLEDERKQVTLLERRYHEALSRYLEQARRVVELEDGMTRLCRQVTLLHERLSRQSSQLAGCGISVPPLPALKDLLPAAAELKLSPVTTEKTKAGSSRRQKKS